MTREMTLRLPRRKVEYQDVLLEILRKSSSYGSNHLNGDDRQILKEICDAFMGEE